MAGRPDERERGTPAGDDVIERDERTARRAERAVVRRRIDVGVAGGEHARARCVEPFAFALRALDVVRVVHAPDRRGARDADVDAVAEHAAPLQLDRARTHPLRPLHVRNAGQMSRERLVVGDEHGQCGCGDADGLGFGADAADWEWPSTAAIWALISV